jgi:hypothetical protein
VVVFATFTFATDHKPKPLPQQVFAPYWTAEPGWHSEFQLRNSQSSAPLVVTPLLRLANGQEYSLRAVTIPPSDVVTVDVSDELQKLAPALTEQAGTYGSVLFRFVSPAFRNLYAAVMVHEIGQPIGYHIDAFGMDDGANAWSREGIWWLPRPGIKDNLIIANGSDKANRGRLFLYDAAGKAWQQDVPLGPRQSVRFVVGNLVKTAGLIGKYGGIRFEVAERAGSVDAVHFLYDETSGFSALMKMFDHDPAAGLQERLYGSNTVWTTRAPMLALQNPDPALALPPGIQLQPQVLIRNATPHQQTAIVKLTWRGDAKTGVVTLDPLQLQSFETRLIDVQALQLKEQVPLDAHWALVEISSPTAKPDDLMAIASSYDRTGRFGAQTPFIEELSNHWAAGQWQVDATHNSLITVTNGGTMPVDALVTFHYNHGQSEYELQKTIAPGDQVWLNMGNLIHGAVPDRKGGTFPADLTFGTYDVRQPHGAGNPSLLEGKIIVDETYGHLAYGCADCCGYTATYFNPDPYTDQFGYGTWDTILAQDACDDGQDDVTYYATDWASDNQPVATVANAYTNLVSPGTANGSSYVALPWGQRLHCPQVRTHPAAPIHSKPILTVSGNAFIFVGSDPQLLSANKYFATTAQPTGGTFTVSSSDSHDTFTSGFTSGIPWVTVTSPDQSTTNGDRTLTFTYTVNGENATQVMHVTARQFAYLTNPSPPNACTGTGTNYTFTYTVYTHPDRVAIGSGDGLNGTLAPETFNPPPPLPCGTEHGDGALNSNGQLIDNVAYCSTGSPLLCSGQVSQTLSVGGFSVRTNTLIWSTTGISVTNNGPFQ